MAVHPSIDITDKVIPDTIDGIASFTITLNIICDFVAPKDLAASIKPSSTSFNAFSIILAINGAAAIVMGTMAAVSPILVPTINFVNGLMATRSMIKGKLLTVFTMKPSMLYTVLFGLRPLGLVITNIIAIINPKIVATIVGTIIIYKV